MVCMRTENHSFGAKIRRQNRDNESVLTTLQSCTPASLDADVQRIGLIAKFIDTYRRFGAKIPPKCKFLDM